MGTVVGSWRLKLLLILVILMSIIYTVNGIFYGIETDEEGYILNEDIIKENDTAKSIEQSNDFMTVLFGWADFFTFGNIDNPYARIILNLVNTVCLIAIGYILFTFIKEFIPFV